MCEHVLLRERQCWHNDCLTTRMETQSPRSKVAITVWEDRVSPVFDAANTLLIVEIVDAKVIGTHYHRFDPTLISQLIHILGDQGVMLIICGAVSEGPARLLEAAGLELIPFIAGNIREVLAMLVLENPVWRELKMPGCGRDICCRGKIRHGKEIKGMHLDSIFK